MSDYVRIRAFDQRTLQIVEALSRIVADYIELVGGEDPLEARLDRDAH